ncbi:uncharacterized protein LOC108145061 [Drosophila elegans]|uniref:uncharacterized protein LOC108145061 n=1 Tax=Drosophila elegans TaxID=30023 RepID=UPI001BC843DC|nr:uncharacterized protein LOC108145061 [Drosophila elegans]
MEHRPFRIVCFAVDLCDNADDDFYDLLHQAQQHEQINTLIVTLSHCVLGNQHDLHFQARFALMHFNRGNWEPTLFTLVSQDFCAALFDEGQSWFKQWTKHISNRDEVQKKCLKTRGTVWMHNPFDLQLRLYDIRGANLQGRYKAVVTFEAFDERDVPRKNSICFEIRGEAEKIKK